MSCLASKQVETCNCSEPRFPTNSYACLTVQQCKFHQLSLANDRKLISILSISLFFGKEITELRTEKNMLVVTLLFR